MDLKLLAGGSCALTVRDDGVGLPLDLDIEHAATLGLQLVQDLTHQLHGTLAIGRNGGTTFAMVFDADGGGQPPP